MALDTSASFKQSTSSGCNEPFSSPLFYELVAEFNQTTRHVILELGSASSGILALLQNKRCRLLVANASMDLSALDEKTQSAESIVQEVARLIFDAGEEKVDTVFCWDLLNYLSLPMIQTFSARLAAIMSPGGMVHAYIHSANANMPLYPPRYSPQGENLVLRVDHDPDTLKTPRYSFGDLEKYADGLHVDRSMLLRNGIQEYLLRVK
jgi:hypothetical protein